MFQFVSNPTHLLTRTSDAYPFTAERPKMVRKPFIKCCKILKECLTILGCYSLKDLGCYSLKD